MRGDLVSRVLGAIALVAVLPFLLWVEEPTGALLAFTSAFTGAVLLFIVPERSVPEDAAAALSTGSAVALAEVAGTLGLKGHAIYAPAGEQGEDERLFLPTRNTDLPLPVLETSSATYAGEGGTKVGMAFTPPGRALMASDVAPEFLAERSHMKKVEAFLGGLGRAKGLFASIAIDTDADGASRDAAWQVSFQPSRLRPACLDADEPGCPSTGCAMCQVIGCSMARATAGPVELWRSDVEADQVVLHLRRVS